MTVAVGVLELMHTDRFDIPQGLIPVKQFPLADVKVHLQMIQANPDPLRATISVHLRVNQSTDRKGG